MEKNYSRHKKKLLRLSPLYDILSSSLMFNLSFYLHFLRDFPYLHFFTHSPTASCCALHAQAI